MSAGAPPLLTGVLEIVGVTTTGLGDVEETTP